MRVHSIEKCGKEYVNFTALQLNQSKSKFVEFLLITSVFHSGVTKYLVVFPLQDESQANKSASIKRMNKFKIKPNLVYMEWLISTLESGIEQPA